MQKAQTIGCLKDYIKSGAVADLAVCDTLGYVAEYADLHWLEEDVTLAELVLAALRALPKATTRAARDAISMFSDDMVGDGVPPNPTDLRVLQTLTGVIFMDCFSSHLAIATSTDKRLLQETLAVERRQATEAFQRFCHEKLLPFPKHLSRDVRGITISAGCSIGKAQVMFHRNPFTPTAVFTSNVTTGVNETHFLLTSANSSLKEVLGVIETASTGW